MVKNKEIDSYISSIKTLLPLYSKSEKAFIKRLRDSIYTFIESHPDSSVDDVIGQFGEPFDIVQGYIEAMEIEALVTAISIRRMLRKITIIILIAAIIGLAIFGGYYYKGYQYYINTVVTENDTTFDTQ